MYNQSYPGDEQSAAEVQAATRYINSSIQRSQCECKFEFYLK